MDGYVSGVLTGRVLGLVLLSAVSSLALSRLFGGWSWKVVVGVLILVMVIGVTMVVREGRKHVELVA